MPAQRAYKIVIANSCLVSSLLTPVRRRRLVPPRRAKSMYQVKCDECKKEIRQTPSQRESMEGGLCDTCWPYRNDRWSAIENPLATEQFNP